MFESSLAGCRDRLELLGTLEMPGEPAELTDAGILDALWSPLWPSGKGRPAFEVVKPGESVCVVVSDHTRKTAADRILPVLLDGFRKTGCRDRDFFLLFAGGIHRHPRPDEVRGILGDALARQFEGRLFFHEPDDAAALVSVGVTKRGHEVRLNRRAVEADRLVVTGAATYHYHAGFGGGRKSLVPGLAARPTIAWNHSLTLDPVEDRLHPAVEIGRLDGNPVAEEMASGASLCAPDLLVNTVLTPTGRLAGVFAGEMDLAHRAACRLLEKLCRLDIARRADLVVASAEGASNWIQSHKALFNAHRAVAPGGRMVLFAPCPDGLGDERFRTWIQQREERELIRGLRQRPEIYGQTALSTRLRGRDAILVTQLNAADRSDLGLATAPDLPAALDRALRELAAAGRPRPTCWLMPSALSLVPFDAEERFSTLNAQQPTPNNQC